MHFLSDYNVLQSDITAISVWVSNSSSCWFRQKCSCSIAPPTLYIDPDTALLQVNWVKYLSIQLMADLSWSSHIANICSKLCKLIGLTYRQFHLCNPEIAPKLYTAFIRPHLEYVSVLWDPHLAVYVDIQSSVHLRTVSSKKNTNLSQFQWCLLPFRKSIGGSSLYQMKGQSKYSRVSQD